MTFDEFRLAVEPKHKVISHSLDDDMMLKEARASVTLTTAVQYEMRLSDPGCILEMEQAEITAARNLYTFACMEFAKSDHVKEMILKAYHLGSRNGAWHMDDSDILGMVGFHDSEK